MHAFIHLIWRTRNKLISWSNNGLNSLEANMNKIELEILDVENFDVESVSDVHQDLSALYNKLSALQRQNSLKLAQRARLLWVQCGDNNSSFFHNSVRFRNHHNNISIICDSNGACISNRFGIVQVFVLFSLIFGPSPLADLLKKFFTPSLMTFLPSLLKKNRF